MESDDEQLLAPFKRIAHEQQAAIAPTDALLYEPFSVKDRRQLSLYIRPVGEPYQWVTYRYLLHMVAAPAGDRLDLVFSFMLVTLSGRNLLEIGDAIAKERCAFLQQFDAKKWPHPKDASAPFIESIKYRMSMPSDMADQKETA